MHSQLIEFARDECVRLVIDKRLDAPNLIDADIRLVERRLFGLLFRTVERKKGI